MLISELEDRLRHMGYSSGRHVLKEVSLGVRGETRHNYRIYTAAHEYSLSAYEGTPEKPGGYLGCVASTRKARPGENHTRGNDLPDGPFNEETWNAILARIVSYELEPLSEMCGPRALDPFPAPELPRGIPAGPNAADPTDLAANPALN